MVVIDRDYFKCPEDEIRQIRPVMTILNGKVVYRAQATTPAPKVK
jgi:predicted amidohydrolase YtcJ